MQKFFWLILFWICNIFSNDIVIYCIILCLCRFFGTVNSSLCYFPKLCPETNRFFEKKKVFFFSGGLSFKFTSKILPLRMFYWKTTLPNALPYKYEGRIFRSFFQSYSFLFSHKNQTPHFLHCDNLEFAWNLQIKKQNDEPPLSFVTWVGKVAIWSFLIGWFPQLLTVVMKIVNPWWAPSQACSLSLV